MLMNVIEREKQKILAILDSTTGFASAKKAIVNAPFVSLLVPEFDLGTVVLLIQDVKNGYIERVALSDTAAADGAVKASALPFEKIKIPSNYQKSAHVKALRTMSPVILTDWYDMFRPALSAEQARHNQNGAGILTSLIYPFKTETIAGTVIFSLYREPEDISEEAYSFFDWYAKTVGTVLSSRQK